MTYLFDLLHYHDLDTSGLEHKFKKTCEYLQSGDFKSADVKKLATKGYYRAKLDYTNRVLFKPIRYQNKTYLLILEIIRNHAYEKSRFLRGAEIKEVHVNQPDDLVPHTEDNLRFLGDGNQKVHYLNRFMVFDDMQERVFHYGLPLILIGSAGSGKTSLTLEKIKTMVGDVLYVTLSSYLTQNARQIYYAHNYQNDDQSVDFLSFEELVETIAIPTGKEISIAAFLHWHQRQHRPPGLGDGRKLYEEFRGVLSGSEPLSPYLNRENYLNLGIKKSIYSEVERDDVYRLFQNYLKFLEEGDYFDTNILSYHYTRLAKPRYDAVIIDEVQDLTNSQLSLIFSLLRSPKQFFMCGDANQIVHPNFFSWSGLKQLFYTADALVAADITQILTRNYRNTREVTELANRVLKLKNARFGSIDKESHYLIESQTAHTGDVACVKSTAQAIRALNIKICRSINVAVIVFTDKQKEEARELFDTPLVFSVQEAKGLEYEHIILYNFMGNEQKFLEIAQGLDRAALTQEFKYGRAKSKADKSIELYKFYINSLYVAITRAIKSVYLLEKDPSHPLISLLDINEINHSLTMDIAESSMDEWQQEASRLTQQGKSEQAAAINQNILKQQTTPWQVIGVELYAKLKDLVVSQKTATKKETMSFFEAAMVYDDENSIIELQNLNFKAAKHVKKSYSIMYNKHFHKYSLKNNHIVHKEIQLYGLEHRNPVNFTPLMSAIYAGNLQLTRDILHRTPELTAQDSSARNALQIAVDQAINSAQESRKILGSVYAQLSLESISMSVDGHLVKIDSNRAEYMLITLIMTFYKKMLQTSQSHTGNHGFTAKQLFVLVKKLPEHVWPEFRKKQMYLSSILSRNEVDSLYHPNRKLFQRQRRGYYILNPDLRIKRPDWINIQQAVVGNFQHTPSTAS